MTARRYISLLPELRASDAVVVTVLLVMVAITALAVDDAPGSVLATLGVGAVQTLPVLWRRERPIAALLVFGATVPPAVAVLGFTAAWSWAVLVFAVVRRSRPVPGTAAVVGTWLVAPVLAGFASTPGDPTRALGLGVGLAVSVLPILAGAAVLALVAGLRAAQAAARRRAEERDRLADALAAQRDRLAGDLRDLVAVRVERVVARIRTLGAPDLDAHLAGIGAEARAALAGMRRALTVLRAPEAAAAPDPGPPVPGRRASRWVPTRGGVVLAAVVAVAVAGLAVVAAATLPHTRPGRIADLLTLLDVDVSRPLGLVPLAVQVLALAWWRRAPLPALVVATAGSTAAALLHSTHLVTETSWGVLVYGAGLGAGVVASGVTVALCSAGVLVTTVVVGLPAAVGQSTLSWVLSYVLVPALWGLGVLQRRSAAAEARRAAERAAERAAAEVRAQRLGLARDLHDVLAHELSALVVTLHAAHLDPAPATITAIRETGERIAAALPTLLDGAPHQLPLLDAGAVEDLVAPVRDAGLPVEVEVVGTAPTDRPEADVLAARIVTEALTNALRHAGPSPTRVAVRHEDEAVTVDVADGGVRPGHRAAGREGSGLGLVGMRERAALVGGTVEAGPYGTGWRVLAHLPRRSAGLLPEEETAGDGSASRRTITSPSVP